MEKHVARNNLKFLSTIYYEYQNESNPLFEHSAVMNDTSRQNRDASMIAFFIAGAFASRRVAYMYRTL